MRMFNTKEEWEDILMQSEEQPVVVLKHSNTCPVSSKGYTEVQKFEEEVGANVYVLVVQDVPELKIQIADETGTVHESPQVLILKNRSASYTVSHFDITTKNLITEYNKVLQ